MDNNCGKYSQNFGTILAIKAMALTFTLEGDNTNLVRFAKFYPNSASGKEVMSLQNRQKRPKMGQIGNFGLFWGVITSFLLNRS